MDVIACPESYTPTGKERDMRTRTAMWYMWTNWWKNYKSEYYTGAVTHQWAKTNYVHRGPKVRMGSLQNPAGHALIADHEQDNQSNAGLPRGIGVVDFGWPTVHERGLNVSYYDGHVQFYIDPDRSHTFWVHYTRYYGNGDCLMSGGYDLE